LIGAARALRQRGNGGLMAGPQSFAPRVMITTTLPLFPLNTVLFPEGRLPLRIFEARYMDMIGRCMREVASFGVCAIAAGREVGEAAVPRLVGTEAHIEDWDMSQPGLLHITVRGARRFAIEDHEVEPDGLLLGKVRWLPDYPSLPVMETETDILPLLRRMVAQLGDQLPGPHRFDDAAWVGARYAELLPISLDARQALLELDDVQSRIEIIRNFLLQHDLLKA
jgi:Lon protease-like protein